MLNERSLSAIEKSVFSVKFRKPLYDSYCFSRVPATVELLLTGEASSPLPLDTIGEKVTYDVVVLFFIDGFGWEFFEKYASQYPFLSRFLQEGIASKMTSQFPSTTAAHVTTMNTALEVGQTGVYEWFYYEPLVDRMITPLLYSYAGDHKADTLSVSGVAPEKLYPTQTLYQAFQKKGIQSYVMQHEGIAHSSYSNVMFSGAHNVPYRSLKEGLANVINLCQAKKNEPTYIYFYFGDIDAAGHRHGIDSLHFIEAVDACWKTLEEHYWQKMGSIHKKIASIVIADHGMAPVDPKKTFYLNRVFPDIAETFVTNKEGRPLVPAGSCRDFFLHIKPECLDSVLAQTQKEFEGIAEVYKTKKLIKEGFFGRESVSEKLLKRIGNLVILPYYEQSIWWYEKHHFEQHFYAAHGGLTPQEMESIFLFLG